MTKKWFILLLLVVVGTPRLNLLACETNGQRLLEFIYIDATEGEAAAGHSAVKLGNTVFHYQFHPNKLLLLSKQDWDDFRHYYNDLSNRTLKIKALLLTDPTFEKIKYAFLEQYLRQEIELARHANLNDQLQLLSQISRHQNLVEINGIGLFSPFPGTAKESGRQLKSKVMASLSSDFLQQLLSKTQEQISSTVQNFSRTFLSQTESSAINETAIVSLQELLSLREALNILLEEKGLLTTSIVRLESAIELSDDQQKYLRQFQQQIGHSIIELISSDRSDRGPILLVQIARYLVLGYSLEQNELLTLSPFQDGTKGQNITQKDIDPQLHNFFREKARFFNDRVKKTFFNTPPSRQNIAYSMLEKARGHLQKYEKTVDKELADWSLIDVCGTPCRSGKVSIDHFTPDSLPYGVIKIQQRVVREFTKYLVQKYGYNLFSRNCATELVRTINSAFSDRDDVKESLGGYLEPEESVSFIPFGLDHAVDEQYPITNTLGLPSYRLRNLQNLYHEEGISAWFRESNTLTSTLYSPWKKDGYFLFFTDDTVVIRPFLGLINLGYSILHTIGGVVTAPVDRGTHFMRGVKGVVFSLPELFFFNIRKGSYQIIDNDN